MSDISPERAAAWPFDLLRESVDTAMRAWRASADASLGMIRGDGPNPMRSVTHYLGVAELFRRYTVQVWKDPAYYVEKRLELASDYARITANLLRRLHGQEVEPVAEVERGDRRFRDPEWTESPVFDAVKQSYLRTADAILDVARQTEGLEESEHAQLLFNIRQLLDTLSPSNFPQLNPEVLSTTVRTGGLNLLRGWQNLIDDLESGNGYPHMKMSDVDAFGVGSNLAVTPGKVVYRNELMELIQYAPTTEQVARRPVLVVPPWLNKYYVLDLQPHNSLVRWMVDQGHTVFMVSWVNPDERHVDKTFDDYLTDGPLDALRVIEELTGEQEVNAVGYCLGGIVLSAALSWLRSRGEAHRVASATLLTTLLDYSEIGDIGAFIDEDQVDQLEKRARRRGYLHGANVSWAFRAIRANDLIWSYFVNNYLLGREHAPFDILYWNADATNMPATAHPWFIRNMYLHNRLREPGGVTLAGEAIDLSQVQTPAYVLSTHEDHIAPWRTTYEATRILGGPVRFVLGDSGHIAGIVNPPGRDKYGYHTNEATPDSAAEWLDGAQAQGGSWWPDWHGWVLQYAGGVVPARLPGQRGEVLADAPGTYVRVRIDEPQGLKKTA